MLLLYLAKWNALLSVKHKNTKEGQNSTKKNISLLLHIVELSTTVVEVDTKDTNASLTQNQCLQCACWDTATTRRHWTEQWRHYQAEWHPLPNRTEFINFSERDLINDDYCFCSHILWISFYHWLAVSCFCFWKAFVIYLSLSLNGIFDDVRYDVTST